MELGIQGVLSTCKTLGERLSHRDGLDWGWVCMDGFDAKLGWEAGAETEVGEARMHPLMFEPILKRLIWGGRRLATLGKRLGAEADYAESWEVADHGADVSVVSTGPLAGTPLRALMIGRRTELLGRSTPQRGRFPLLLKYLDAHATLSVQVHPDDARANILADDGGKTEAWVVLHAEPGACLYAGFVPGVTPELLRQALVDGTVEQLLHKFETQAGDCVFLAAGTVHAIGAGVLLAEVQQTSDATFRLYDWGRLGADGRPRPLHIEQALACLDFERGPVFPIQPKHEQETWGIRERLVDCFAFRMQRWRVERAAHVGNPECCTVVMVIEGSMRIPVAPYLGDICTGGTVLLPAALGRVDVEPLGAATLLVAETVERAE